MQFVRIYAKLLMDGMNEALAKLLNASTEPDGEHLSCDQLESGHCDLKRHLRRRVLVSEDEDSLSLW